MSLWNPKSKNPPEATVVETAISSTDPAKIRAVIDEIDKKISDADRAISSAEQAVSAAWDDAKRLDASTELLLSLQGKRRALDLQREGAEKALVQAERQALILQQNDQIQRRKHHQDEAGRLAGEIKTAQATLDQLTKDYAREDFLARDADEIAKNIDRQLNPR